MRHNEMRYTLMTRKDELLEEISNKSGIQTTGLDEAMDNIIDAHTNDEVSALVEEYFTILREERYADYDESKALKESVLEPTDWIDDKYFKDLVGDEAYYESIEIWKEKGLIR